MTSKNPDRHEPLEDVPPVQPPPEPGDAARGEMHDPAGVEEILHDLATGLGGPDDEDGPCREGGRAAVRGRVELEDVPWQLGGDRRDPGDMLHPGRHHDGAGLQRLARPGDRDIEREGAVGLAAEARDLHAGADREPGQRGIGLEVSDPGRAGCEAVRRPDVLRRTRESVHPGRRVERERVPALAAPRLGDATALEDDVVHAPPRKVPAHGEAARPRPDDDRLVHPEIPPVVRAGAHPARRCHGTQEGQGDPVSARDLRAGRPGRPGRPRHHGSSRPSCRGCA